MSGVIRITDGAATFRGEFACPHCGHVNSRYFSWWSSRPEVVCCDCEEGGCDTYFTVSAQVQIAVTPTVRKIEGIEPMPTADDVEFQAEMDRQRDAHEADAAGGLE